MAITEFIPCGTIEDFYCEKKVDATKRFSLDLRAKQYLDSADIILSSSWAVGTLTNNGFGNNDDKAWALISGGAIGETHVLTVTVDTQLGESLVFTITIEVV